MNFPKGKKPNFFIVGAPKAGTTSLYHHLRNHPDIFLSDLKETNYFSYKEIEAQGLYYETKNIKTDSAYVEQFLKVSTEKIIGEASVSYLFYENTAQRIYDFNPNSTIVILLRNPVERAYSHYLMDYEFGYIDLDFEEVVFKTTNHKYADLYYQQYIKLGFYANQIQRYLDRFHSQVKIYLMEQFIDDKEQLFSDLFSTLGLAEMNLSEDQKKHNKYKTARLPVIRKLYGNYAVKNFVKTITGNHLNVFFKKMLFRIGADKPKMKPSTRNYLQELYEPHIVETQKLIDQNLDHWYD